MCRDIIDKNMKCVGTDCCDDADFCNAQMKPSCEPANSVIQRTMTPLHSSHKDVQFKRGEEDAQTEDEPKSWRQFNFV